MEQKTLSADVREETRKGTTRNLRRQGRIPAVMYGHAGTASVSIDEHEFGQKFKRITENAIVKLEFGGASHDVLVKDFQEDVLTGRIIHIDFFEIESGKVLRTNVPVHLIGNPQGVREGGLLEQRLHELEVECLPKDIPEQVGVDVTALLVGDAIHVGDLPSLEGVRVLNTPDQIIVAVTHPKEEVLVAAAEEEEMAEAAAEAGAESAEGADAEEE